MNTSTTPCFALCAATATMLSLLRKPKALARPTRRIFATRLLKGV